SADIIIVRDDLGAIAESIMLSRKTLGTIRGNLVWAFGYNVLAIPIAMFGLLNPLISAAAMAMSSVFVVYNSLRLQRVKLHPWAGGSRRLSLGHAGEGGGSRDGAAAPEAGSSGGTRRTRTTMATSSTSVWVTTTSGARAKHAGRARTSGRTPSELRVTPLMTMPH